ncbi:GNAT family N-acetyltransferase [Vibrio sonorensis]|uniref:GNAT family N-acetyltransferase n=1 Tax=Vibrio sonorensis TaxID=1004316 RepID=UPI0008DA85C3|nr:GNAT family N-acetyltransferase [Vibrio sonorensis]
MLVRAVDKRDLADVAEIHKVTFVRQGDSLKWLSCAYQAYPKSLMYIACEGTEILGFVIWTQKSGFRKEAVLELELLAVKPESQGKGVAKQLISDSKRQVEKVLKDQGSTLKHILVTTRADNYAQQLYRSTLGAEVEFTIPNLYSADEVLMIARNVEA